MTLARVVAAGYEALIARDGRLPREHRRALDAIRLCRSTTLGTHHWTCLHCQHQHHTPRSCGHRSCPACQNHTTTQWLERQRAKLLPVSYFMATFTLPAQLRGLARSRPKAVFTALFQAASDTLKTFGRNNLGIELGLCAVLHTHSRKLDFHPHVHVVVPGGGLMPQRRQWKTLTGKYLFNENALARVFRAKMIDALNRAGLRLPPGVPTDWVVDCRDVGRGEHALEYLSRYLYRGVIQDHQIVRYNTDSVTFRYRDAATGQNACRNLPLLNFLDILLSHVLPTGLHRVREYGYLHGNAKRLLAQVQLALNVILRPRPPPQRPAVPCPSCLRPMILAATCGPRWHAT